MAATVVGVAIGVPEPWCSQLAEQRARAGDPMAALVPPHVTLLPPTEVSAVDRPGVDEHLEAVAGCHGPFVLHLRGTGTFRPITDVVFVAVASGISACEQLEAGVRGGPLARELRYPYHPHVTVAHDVDQAALDAAYERLAGFDAQFRVAAFTLFEHGGDGRWRPVREFALRGPAA